MDFSLDEEQQLIVATFRRFADEARKLGQQADESADAGAGAARSALAKAADLGVGIDAIPEAAGGMLSGAYSHTIRTLRGLELGRGCAGVAALLESNVEPALAAARWASPEVAAALHSALAGGALATTTHDALGRLTITTAASGDLSLDGTLGPVPALADAAHIVISARDAAGPVIILAPASAFTITPVFPSGWRAARWARLDAKAVRLPAAAVLTRDPAAQHELLSWYKLSLAARAIGVADFAMQCSSNYGQERVQFNQPIGSFESLARMQDQSETATLAGRFLVLSAAAALDARSPDYPELCSRARDFAAGVVRRASIDAVQIYGGYGFVRDFPVEKLMRDARAFEVLAGDEALTRVLARRQDAASYSPAPAARS